MINYYKLKIIKSYMPKFSQLSEMAEFFSVFSDITRIRILSLLSISEMCVGDISSILEISQSTVSHQLKYLKNFDLVDYRREGKVIFYYVCNNSIYDMMDTGIKYLGIA